MSQQIEDVVEEITSTVDCMGALPFEGQGRIYRDEGGNLVLFIGDGNVGIEILLHPTRMFVTPIGG